LSIGAAIGTFCAEASVCIMQTLAVRKELPVRKYIVQSAPLVGMGVFMYVVLWYFCNFGFGIKAILLKVLIGGSIYILLLLTYIFFNKDLCSIVSKLTIK
jgi:hypothetical protein